MIRSEMSINDCLPLLNFLFILFLIFQLFRLLTKSDHCFEDNFTDQPVVVSYLRRKLAPHTVAVYLSELSALLEADQVALQNLELNEEVISTKTSTRNTTEESKTVIFISKIKLAELTKFFDEFFEK